MLAVGGLKAAAKRTAFGDLSNIVSNTKPSKDDASIAMKSELPSSKNDHPLQIRKSIQILRPTQRPLSVAGLKGFLTGTSNAGVESTNKSNVAEDVASTQGFNSRKTLIKRNTTILKDSSLDANAESEPASKLASIGTEPGLNQQQDTAYGGKDVVEQEPRFLPPLEDAKLVYDPVKAPSPIQLPPSFPSVEQTVPEKPHHSEPVHPVEASKRDHQPLDAKADDVQPAPETETLPTVSQALALPAMSQAIPSQSNSYLPQTIQKQLGTQPIPPLLPYVPRNHMVIEPEPEEHWDEDDEEPYEEEGYVTARSYRSRSENTTGGATTVLFPQVNQKVRREISAAKHLVEATRTVEEIEDESYDTSMVAEYGDEIFEYMRELEVKMLPNAHYMDNQHEIQWSMRAVLMDWLVQVHHRFNLLPETLFLCVNYIDRFLSAKVVSLGKLQLVGATAIFIAAKYEEINCPSVQEIVFMVDNGYTIDEVLKAERFMLTMLQFELGWPGPMSFLRRISKADDYDLETRTLAKYFLEVTIMDERFIGSPPSFAAAASHCLARMMLQKGYWVSVF